MNSLIIVLCIVAAALAIATTTTMCSHSPEDHSHHHRHHHDHHIDKIPLPPPEPAVAPSPRPPHRCIHDERDHSKIIKRHLHESASSPLAVAARQRSSSSVFARYARPEALSKIRIVVSDVDLTLTNKYCTAAGDTRPNYKGGTVTCRAEDVLTDEKRNVLKNKVLPAALGLLQGMLQMEPTSSPIVVPDDACSGLSYTIPSSHSSSGVANADYVLYVSAGRTPDGVLAFAGGCGYDTAGRIVYGRANFGPEYLLWSDTNPAANDDLIKTAVHEIFHALGFSYQVFSGKSGIVSTASVRGKTVTMHLGEKAKTEARAYFGCNTLSGVELEDEGGDGSALSHVDKRLMPTDFMAASGGTLISKISIAMLADLGFYTPLHESVQNQTFGLNGGCGFIDSKCNTNAGGRDKFFCFDASLVDTCSYDYSGSGFCGISSFSSDLPSHFQYFAGEPKKGGRQFLDFCPIVELYSNRVCNFERQASQGDYIMGFTFARTSRCFKTSGVVRSGYGDGNVGTTRCLVSKCESNGMGGWLVFFQVNGSSWIECTGEGTAIGSLPGYDGSVICPQSFNDFCFWYDKVPAPPDGYPESFIGSIGVSNDNPYGQVPTRSGAISWIVGTLSFFGAGWKNLNSTTPPAPIVTALQRDIAGLLALNVRDVFITKAEVVAASSSGSGSESGEKVLRIDYLLTNTQLTTETVNDRFSKVKAANSTAWLGRTRNEYQIASGATDSPTLNDYSADYTLSFLERLFLGLGVGPFSGIVVAGFLAVCIVVAIVFCFCRDKCCPTKKGSGDGSDDDDVDDNFRNGVGHNTNRPVRNIPPSARHVQQNRPQVHNAHYNMKSMRP